jgi:hypothetical protein
MGFAIPKFMQSARVLPPPPGVLAAASLALALALPAEARLLRPGAVDDDRFAGVPPLDNGVVVIWGGIVGRDCSEGDGAPIADDSAGVRGFVAGFAGVIGGVACAAPRGGL